MKARQLPLLLFALLVFVSPLQAKKKHHDHPEYQSYVPPPNEAVPAVRADAMPSASLQPFLDTHVERMLAPLGKEEFNQPWIVAGLKSNYAEIMAAAPDTRKPAFAAAEFVCDALTNAMAEREKAVNAWHGSSATHSSEGDQPRGGRAEGRQERGGEDDFFRRSMENNWLQRVAALRANIQRLDQREHALEIQAASAVTTPAPDAAPTATPQVSAAR